MILYERPGSTVARICVASTRPSSASRNSSTNFTVLPWIQAPSVGGADGRAARSARPDVGIASDASWEPGDRDARVDEEPVSRSDGPDEIGHDLARRAGRVGTDGDPVVARLDDAHRHALVGAGDAVVGLAAGAHSMTLAFRSSSSCS